MTNEELAAMIQAGERDRLAELWAQVERFVSQQAGRRARALGGYGGVTAEDLYQSGFLAMVDAADSYDVERGLSFIGWLAFYLKTAFAEAAGYQKPNPLTAAESLDASIPGADGVTLADGIEDPGAAQDFEDAETAIWREQLHAAMEEALHTLPEDQAGILQRRFYLGKTLAEISAAEGVELEQVRRREGRALSAMRKPQIRQRLLDFVEARTPYYSGTGLRSFRQRGSQPERLVIWREEQEERFTQEH